MPVRFCLYFHWGLGEGEDGMRKMQVSAPFLPLVVLFLCSCSAAEYALFPVAPPGEASCFPCPAGTFSWDTPYCVPCPKGTYTMERESTNCTACPSGWTTQGEGSSSVWQCTSSKDGTSEMLLAAIPSSPSCLHTISFVHNSDNNICKEERLHHTTTRHFSSSTLQTHVCYLHVVIFSRPLKF